MRSMILCRTNSSRKRSGPERIPASSRTTAFCRLPPRTSPRARSCSISRANPKVRAGEMREANSSGLKTKRQLLAAHDRVREVDLVGDREGGTVRLVDHPAVFPRDLDRAPTARSGPRAASWRSKPGGVEEAHEGEGGPVQDRDLGPFDLDEAVVQADTRRRRQDVLDGADRDSVVLEGRRVVEGGGRFEAGGDGAVGVVHAQENEPVVDRRGTEVGLGGMPRVQADSLDRDRGSQCRLLSHAFYTQSVRSQ